LVPLTAAALDALIDKDRAQLETLTGARFPEPLLAPPLMEDALPSLRDVVLAIEGEAAGEGALGWGPWLASTRATSEAIGCVALGRPDDRGRVVLGYAIYPHFEGRGYATEATRALITWSLEQVGVAVVWATIPPWHTPSLRVAHKVGMRQVGTAHDEEVGEVLVFEAHRAREAATAAH
jgi:RimJ/RimL family protein N-acetyltransferase